MLCLVHQANSLVDSQLRALERRFEQAERLAGQMLEALNTPMTVAGETLDVGASIGIAMLSGKDGGDMDLLLQQADLALNHAKTSGRGCSKFFAPFMTSDLARKRDIEAELRAAIQRDELSVFYQPIVELATGRIVAFEALIRWFHPTRGELQPDEFIPVAEDTGVIVTIGNWVTKQAARACANWPEDIHVSVNLSPLQVKAPGASLGSGSSNS